MKDNSKIVFSVIALMFFLSGACGLVYEVVWLRMLGLVFGNTTFAISTVLAAFMAGLGLGSFFFGRHIDKKGDPVLIYGLLEIGIGVFCIFTPALWKLIENLYVLIYQQTSPTFFQFSLIRFFMAFILMLIPTFLMGGTLPVLMKFLVRNAKRTAEDAGFLYGINTFGACVGVLFSSFFAIYYFGLKSTVFIAAAINIVIGIASLFLFKKGVQSFSAQNIWQTSDEQERVSLEPVGAEKNNNRLCEEHLILLLFLGFGLSGFTSMAYEICWTKILALCLGSSVYSFAIMLATFLIGLALGSLVIGWLSKRIRINYLTFAFVELAIAFFVLIGIRFFNEIPFYFLRLFSFTKDVGIGFQLGRFLLCSLVMLLPTIFIGATFAIVTQLLNRSARTTGKTVGSAYCANTMGCIFGSFAVGFILVPLIGILQTLVVAICINLFVGVAILIGSEKILFRKKMIAPACLVLAVLFLLPLTKGWSKNILTTNIAINPQAYLGHNKYQIKNSLGQREMLFYKEGLSGIVTVKRKQGNIMLAINSNIDASSGDMFTQLMLGHLPTLLLAQPPKKALVIGMGSGVTLAALAAYPYDEIHCVELERGVVEAAEFFLKENRNVLKDARLKNFINDGRNHLLVEKDLYDVIVSEPSSPWMAGVANLFTIEQFELMKSRLKSGGIVCQWCNTYSMSPENIKMIVKTFQSVFKHVSLWNTTSADFLLIGSDDEQVYDFGRVDQIIKSNQQVSEDLSQFKISGAAGLLSCFLLTNKELKKMSEDANINNDNFPRLEYSAPLNLYNYETVVAKNQALVEKHRHARYPKIVNMKEDKPEKVSFHNALTRAYLKKDAFAEKAILELSVSNGLEEKNPGAVFNFGLLQLKNNNPDSAIENFSDYVKRGTPSAEAYFYLAKAYALKGEHKLALAQFQKAVEIEPKNSEYLFAYAQSLIKFQRYLDAIRYFEQGIKEEGLEVESGLKLSEAYFLSGDFSNAMNILEVLLINNPHLFLIYENMAKYCELVNKPDYALAIYEKAAEILPYNIKIYHNMSVLYQKMGSEDKAAVMTKKVNRYRDAPALGSVNP